MSNTRHAKPGSPLRQERYCSSYERGLLANLVAKRCAVVDCPQERELIWFLQWVSWLPGGLAEVRHWLEWTGAPADYCLDPGSSLSEACLQRLHSCRTKWLKDRASGRVQTSAGQRISSALDYIRDAKTLGLIDGPSRLGKSFEARAWCEQTGGMARYVEVPSSPDEGAFLQRIARALGVASGLESKVFALRARIEDVLQAGDLMLVMDEAHYLWPAGRLRCAVPVRVNWINTALANYHVPVALITTPQFYTAQLNLEKQTGWNADQFVGRIGHVERLPQKLSREDLLRVASVMLPGASSFVLRKLAVYAELSRKHLASIEAIAKRASWLASRAGRAQATEQDVDGAIRESVIPTDSALAVSLKQHRCERAAPPAPRFRGTPAALSGFEGGLGPLGRFT